MDVIKIRLVDLLRDREKCCSVPEQAGRWLMSDVCARDSITHSGGTFR